jgi:hypothetical protein
MNMNDLDIIKFFVNKENYDKYNHLVDTKLFHIEPLTLYKALPAYHEAFVDYDVNSFTQWFLHFKTDEATRPIYKQVCKMLTKCKDQTQEVILRELKTKSLIHTLKSVTEDKLSSDYLNMLADDYAKIENIHDEIEELECLKDYNELFDYDPIANGYEWPMPILNEKINKIPAKGFFCCIAGRPGACKSSFVHNVVYRVAEQIGDDEVVIYFNNEASVDEAKRRFTTTILKTQRDEIFKARKAGEDINKRVEKRIKNINKVKFFDLSFKTVFDAERIIKRHKDQVKLIIVDMLDHVDMKNHIKHITNSDALYGLLYQWWLSVANVYASVIGTSQMNKVDNPRFPRLEDLVGSKNLKQGATSCQLMIGHEEGDSDMRYFSTPKNKYGAGGTHWYAAAKFDSQTNTFSETVEEGEI